MAGQQAGNRVRVSPFDWDGDAFSLGELAAGRNAQLAQRGQAEMAGRQAWADPIHNGRDANALQWDQLRTLGMQPLGGRPPRPGASPGYNPHDARDESALGMVSRIALSQLWNRLAAPTDPQARDNELARTIGLAPGAARGLWRNGKEMVDGMAFLQHLNAADPESAAAWENVIRSGQGLADYTRNAISNPKGLANDVGEAIRRFRVKVDPAASPPADTPQGEWARNINIGKSRGEALTDAALLLAGGAEARGLNVLGRFPRGTKAADYLARGYPENIARYFAEPYTGMGHHYAPQRRRLALLGGRRVPPWISGSRLNLLKPRNVTNGDFFERHYGVDPSYGGGNIPREFGGGGWSGRDLGWTKNDQLGRLWYGSPAPLKGVAGVGIFGMGGLVDHGEGQP